MLLFNGTPDVLRGKVEGTTVTIPIGEVLEVPNQFHGNLLLQQLGPRGLVVVDPKAMTLGAPPNEAWEKSEKAFCRFVVEQVNRHNNQQLEHSRRGLPGIVPSDALQNLASIYEKLTGRVFSLNMGDTKPVDAVAQLTAALAAAFKNLQGGAEVKQTATLLGKVAKNPEDAAEILAPEDEDEKKKHAKDEDEHSKGKTHTHKTEK